MYFWNRELSGCLASEGHHQRTPSAEMLGSRLPSVIGADEGPCLGDDRVPVALGEAGAPQDGVFPVLMSQSVGGSLSGHTALRSGVRPHIGQSGCAGDWRECGHPSAAAQDGAHV